jgi:transcriptional regulator with XRE-family HTH domain
MTDHVLLQIGKKIRVIRQERNETLQTIANRAGVSKGLISKIENGRTVPSLPVLMAIIQALQTDIPSFFEGIEYIKYDGYLHKKAEDYAHIEKEEAVGFHYRSVLEQNFSNFSVEIALLDLMPDARRERVSTDGYTYLYLLQGQIEYILGEDSLVMAEGDSLFFNGKIPHKPVNHQDQMARLLVVYLLMPHME